MDHEAIKNNKDFIICEINSPSVKVKIFGEKFVKNNENKFKIIYENKVYDLIEYFKVDKQQKTLQIKLIKKNNILVNDISYMFDECKTLISLPDISSWDTKRVNKMNYMFCNCSSLTSLPDISKWNTKNVSGMGGIFKGCSSLDS